MSEGTLADAPADMSQGTERMDDSPDLGPIVARAIWLAIKMFFTLLRFKRKARKAARRFEKAAVKGGMSRALARQLGEEYAGYASIRKMIKNVTGDGKIPFLG
jgi:hypothetical protein